ncbi:MAG: PAS domain S-box protein [Candidatus Glassbacteria bacterium]|nr:PAS domain S-box protein [Candidatus Glassbacteria bacterium]
MSGNKPSYQELEKRVRELEKAEAGRNPKENGLPESGKNLRMILDDLTDTIFQLTPSGVIQYVSPNVKKLCGYHPEELIGKHLRKTTPAPEIPKALEAIKEVLAGKTVKALEINQKNSRGKIIPVEIDAGPVRLGGKIVAVQGIMRDLAERKQIDRLLRESEKKYRDLVNNSLVGVYQTNLKGDILYANKALAKIFGFRSIEKLRAEGVLARYRDVKDRKVLIEKLLNAGRVTNFSFEVVAKTGATKNALLSASLDGEVISGMIMDVTGLKISEEALRKSEELFRAVAESASAGISTADDKQNLIYNNPAFVKMLGYSKKEMSGMNISRITDPQEYEKIRKMTKLRMKGLRNTYETVLLRKDGTPLDVTISASPLTSPEGGYQETLAVINDITERKKMEKALLRSIEMERLVIYILTDITNIPAEEIDSGIDRTLRSIGEFFGVDRNFLFQLAENGKHLKLTHEWCAIDLEPLIVKTKEIPASSNYWWMKRLRCFENVQIPRMSNQPSKAKALRDAFPDREIKSLLLIPIIYGRSLIGFTGYESIRSEKTWTDQDIELLITMADIIANSIERKKTEEALLKSKKKYQSLIESTNDIVYSVDTNGNFTYISPQVKRYGYSCEEILSRNFQEWVIPEDRQRTLQDFQRTMSTGEEFVTYFRVADKAELTHWFEENGRVIYDRDGNALGMTGVLRNIDERKQLEEELIKYAKIESLGVLAGGIAHDFNNILGSILGNISLANMLTEKAGKSHALLKEAEDACLRAKDLIQQLITFSKEGAPVKKTASIAEVIEETTVFSLRGTNVKSAFYLADDLWPAEVDVSQISQVINNLVINACQAMPEGGTIRIHAQNIVLDKGSTLPLDKGKYVKISIKDTGTGISQKHLPKIFDPYFTTKQKGGGLGLTTAYSIVQKHSGCITVDSELGVGTTIYIYLSASVKKAQKERIRKKASPGKAKILVMDDDEGFRDALGGVLTHFGHELVLSEKGEEAIEQYMSALKTDQPFDLVILDLTVKGGMGGTETLKRLLEIDPEAKAVVTSGYTNDPIISNYEKYGFAGMITKPFRVQEVKELLHGILTPKVITKK